MKRSIVALAIAASILPVQAQTQRLVAVEVANVAELQASSFGAYVHLQGLAAPGDGNDAYYTQNGFVCTPDNFAIIKDKAGHCFFRTASSNSVGFYALPTIAALVAIAPASIPNGAISTVTDYFGTGTGCPINFTWNSTSTATADGGAVQNPTGNAGAGRWLLNMSPRSPIHSCIYGVKIDNSTDQTARVQALLTWAGSAAGPNYVHIDSKQGVCIKLTSTLTLPQGIRIEGDGPGQIAGTTMSGSCFFGDGFVGPVLKIQTPFPGIGNTPAEAPKIHDLTIDIRNGPTTSPGGCIQFNSIAGGFTDDNTSQQPLIHPEIFNVTCNMGFLNNVTQIGFQCSKCADGSVRNFTSNFGATGIDLEGSENIVIDSGRVAQTFGSMVIFQAHNTFGNGNSIRNFQFLSFMNFGQVADSFVYDAARASTISENFFENFGLPDANVLSGIHVFNAFTVGIHDNNMGIASTFPWLKVDNALNNLTAINNGGSGGIIGAAVFTNSTSFYNTAVKQSLVHYGNGANGDNGWPYNSKMSQEQFLFPKVRQVFTPSSISTNIGAGLQTGGYGLLEKPAQNYYTLPVTGAGNFLDFIAENNFAITGTFDIGLYAWQTSGAGQITCQITDNNTPVGAAVAQAITATPTHYTILTNQVVSTQAGAKCWNTGTGTAGNQALIGQISIQDH